MQPRGQAEQEFALGEEVYLSGGTFVMGSDTHYPEERPAHPVSVGDFWIDVTPVTNRQFAAFVAATGYLTVAERAPDPKDYPGALPHMLRPGSLMFEPPGKPLTGRDSSQWWTFVFGANWRQPYGPGSEARTEPDHPVVQVAHEDAQAYAAWAGKELPSEAEWEFAARGGLDGADYAWGQEFMPNGKPRANTWQGLFPVHNSLADGFARTSPVGSFPPNGYGLYDMIGNVWEWTCDFWTARHHDAAAKPCCIPRNPRVTAREESYDQRQPSVRIPRRVLKGGSHLCAPNYCRRYRPAARHPQPEDSATTHIGFRCIRRAAPQDQAQDQDQARGQGLGQGREEMK